MASGGRFFRDLYVFFRRGISRVLILRGGILESMSSGKGLRDHIDQGFSKGISVRINDDAIDHAFLSGIYANSETGYVTCDANRLAVLLHNNNEDQDYLKDRSGIAVLSDMFRAYFDYGDVRRDLGVDVLFVSESLFILISLFRVVRGRRLKLLFSLFRRFFWDFVLD